MLKKFNDGEIIITSKKNLNEMEQMRIRIKLKSEQDMKDFIGGQILEVKEGYGGILIKTTKGCFEIRQSTYPDQSYDSSDIEKMTEEEYKKGLK